jgi:hypothetical protein
MNKLKTFLGLVPVQPMTRGLALESVARQNVKLHCDPVRYKV